MGTERVDLTNDVGNKLSITHPPLRWAYGGAPTIMIEMTPRDRNSTGLPIFYPKSFFGKEIYISENEQVWEDKESGIFLGICKLEMPWLAHLTEKDMGQQLIAYLIATYII